MNRPLTPRMLARRVTQADHPQVSPDGREISHLIRRADRRGGFREEVVLCDIGGANSRSLSGPGGSARAPRWSPSGDRIAWIRDVPAGSRIEIHHVTTGVTDAVTPPFPEVSEVSWSPSGTTIAFVGIIERSGPRPLADVVDGIAYKEDGIGIVRARAAVHLLTLEDRAVVTLRSPSADVSGLTWSPDGTVMAMRERDPGGYLNQVVLVSMETGTRATIGTQRSRFDGWCWAPDSTCLILAGGEELTFHPSIYRYDRATHQLALLVDEPPCQVVDDPIWVSDRRVLVHGRDRGSSGLWELDPVDGTMVRLASAEGRTYTLSSDATGSVLAQVSESSTRPPGISVWSAPDRTWTRITDPRGGLPATVGLAPAVQHQVPSDGYVIDYWVVTPPDLAPGEQAPAIVLVHGGPHDDVGDDWGVGLEQYLVGLGFIVAWANPRGSTSYGRDFADAVRGDYGGGEFRDLLAVVEALRSRPDVDVGSLGIGGQSHGGYMTAWAIANSDVFRAAVAMAPIFDLPSEWGMSDEGHRWAEIVLRASPRDKPDWFRERSPSTHAWQTRAATLILHGERDERCPIGQSEFMYSVLRSAGVRTEFVRYPGAAHDLLASPALIEDVIARIGAWFVGSLMSAGDRHGRAR